MADWQPLDVGLQTLANLLRDAQLPGSNQAQILQQLEEFKKYPDFNNYLTYVFAKGNDSPEVRQMAGLQLKNCLNGQFANASSEHQKFIKDALLSVLAHPEKVLRQTAGSAIAAVVGAVGLTQWPELISALLQCLQAGEGAAVAGALDTLYKVCEEHPYSLEAEVPSSGGQTAGSLCAPALLKLLQSPSRDTRCSALSCLNQMAKEGQSGIMTHSTEYLHCMFALANDTDSGVRKEVCAGLVQLLGVQPHLLQPYWFQIIEYMLASNEHSDEAVALESCEFWVAFCEAQLEPELLRPFLARLIPVLMKNMVYTDDDEDVQDAEAAEVESSTKSKEDQEAKPFQHKQRDHGPRDVEDDDDDDQATSRWNLRKCSAAGLDRLSIVFGDELLPVLMPIVEQRLQSDDWRARESAILALGAVSEGCHAGLLPYLKPMLAMLLPKLSDVRPMVRVISCWALSRFSYWLLLGASPTSQLPPDMSGPQEVQSAVQGVLKSMQDHNRFVQEAACSALATLCETAGNEEVMDLIEPYLQAMCSQISLALQTYGKRTLRLAYDALVTLAEAAGSRMSNPALISLYMPPLQRKLEVLAPNDRELLPVVECLTTLSPSLGHELSTYAPAMYDKCMNMLAAQVEAKRAASAAQQSAVEYDRDMVVAALDLISGTAEGLGASISSLIGNSPIMQVAAHCCTDEAPDVRQSAFALVGDLSKVCVSHVIPVAPTIIPAAVANLDRQMLTQENMKSCNNACWALGEMAVKMQPSVFADFAVKIAECLAGVLMLGPMNMPRSIIENSAITLGRLCKQCPEQIAPHLQFFVVPWCQALRNIRDDVEKLDAFSGLCRAVRLNPEPALAAFGPMCAAMASWRHVSSGELMGEMGAVLQGCKQSLTARGQWQQAMGSLEPPLQQKLRQMFHL